MAKQRKRIGISRLGTRRCPRSSHGLSRRIERAESPITLKITLGRKLIWGLDIRGNKSLPTAAKDAGTKPPLPQAEADARGVRRFDPNNPRHASGGTAEEQLANTVHSLPDQQVVRWGDPVGSHGSDVISVNQKTGDVTLWDAKYRGSDVRIQESPTFAAKSDARANAINEAIETITNNKTLPPDIKQKAIANLQSNNIQTRTVGFGNAKNSTLGN